MTVLDRTAESLGGWAAKITNGPGGYGGVVADQEWAAEVRKLAEQRNATLLAHNYQLPAIQDIADHVGDSLALSRIAAEARQIRFWRTVLTALADGLTPEDLNIALAAQIERRIS